MRDGRQAAIFIGVLGAARFCAKAIVVELCYRHGAHTETVLALRMIFSLPLFWSAVWWYTATRTPAPMRRKDVVAVLLLGFVGYCLSSYLDFLGLQYISTGLECIILYLSPAIAYAGAGQECAWNVQPTRGGLRLEPRQRELLHVRADAARHDCGEARPHSEA